MQSYVPIWLQDISTVLSIAGFAITVYVMFQVQAIRKHYLAKIRLPDLRKSLSRVSAVLSSSMSDWPEQRNLAHEQVKLARAIIGAALQIMPSPECKGIQRVFRKFISAEREFLLRRFENPDNAWDLYSDVQVCIMVFDQVVKNLNWK